MSFALSFIFFSKVLIDHVVFKDIVGGNLFAHGSDKPQTKIAVPATSAIDSLPTMNQNRQRANAPLVLVAKRAVRSQLLLVLLA